MRTFTPLIFALQNFEGPLALLLHLVQKSEVDIYEITLADIGRQFLSSAELNLADLDQGAEFIAMTAWLNVLKSKALLPKGTSVAQQEQQPEDPHFEIIHQLVDYCRFKGAAKELVQLEQRQSSLYVRGIEPCEDIKKNLGLQHLTLEDLALLFKKAAAKSGLEKGKIQEENFKVSDKMSSLIEQLFSQGKLALDALFVTAASKMELIVIFLALLELMKLGQVSIVKEISNSTVWVMPVKGEIKT